MENLIRYLIPNAKAQSFDALSQPTFGTLDIGTTNVTTGSILLTSSSTSIEVGQSFTVFVEIKTNTVTVSEYRIFIDFDPTALQIIGDADNESEGTQMEFVDDIFIIENPEENNTVQSIGRATLIAKAPAGPLTVNKQVVKIQFQAQKQTDTIVKIVEGNDGSQLIRSQGVNTPYTSNQLTIQIGTSTGSTPPPTQPPPVTVTSVPIQVAQIPNTALAADIATLIPVMVGIILVTLGGSLFLGKSSKEGD